MKITALEFLVCPECKEELDLQARIKQGAEIIEGALSCRRCRAEYSISRDGRERCLPAASPAQIVAEDKLQGSNM
jgi:uncharacterized protein YbaR (Trm112 family)